MIKMPLQMFKELYKTNNFTVAKASQEERRQALLEKQKEERRNLQDIQRPLRSSDKLDSNQRKSKLEKRKNWRQKQEEKIRKSFRETYDIELSLQLSEWLGDVPANLCDWLLVPCPKGQRSLVVAHNRQTSVYNKNGKCVCIFRSMLPGDYNETDSFSILDCIYLREQNAFFVLDVLAFGEIQNLLDCEAEFRFFWLRSKWDELDFLEKRSDHNQKPFHLIKTYDFENMASISEAFEKYPLWLGNKPELDGFLFYHRFAHYTCGTTPLVGWLFAFMVPDVLNIQVNENYNKPEDYSDAPSYMNRFDERLKAKRQRHQEKELRCDKNNENFYPLEKNFECEDFIFDEEVSLEKLMKSQRDLETLSDAREDKMCS